MTHEADRAVLSRQKKLFCEEINCKIDEFNAIRQKAQLQYYYLIVTREALGLRRHEMVQKIYTYSRQEKKRYRCFYGTGSVKHACGWWKRRSRHVASATCTC